MENEQITWNPLINTHYWTVALDEATLGDQSLELLATTAIVDSGTSYTLMP